MKSKFIIISILSILAALMITHHVFTQPPVIEWDRTYGGDRSDMAYSVQKTFDGGYIFAGQTMSFGSDSNDIYLVKTENDGDMQWYRLYGGNDYDDDAKSVQQAFDGGYILAGRTMSFGTGYNDIYVIKTNVLGDSIWTCTYGGANSDAAESIIQTADGGYLIAGDIRMYSAALFEMYLVKIDSLGDTLWTKSYGGSDDRSGYSVKQTIDGGYIFAGWNPFYGGVEYDIYLVKTDGLGDTVWTHSYGGTGQESAFEVQQTTDGGYVVAGWTDSFGAGYGDFYMVKTDSLGTALWTRTYGGSGGDGAYSMKQTPDSGFILAGVTHSFGAANGDLYLVKTDAQGDTLWTIVYGGPYTDCGYSVDLTADGGYIVAGSTHPYIEEPADCWLVKIGPDTSSTHAPAIQWVSHPLDFILHPAYPNPFNASTILTYSIPRPGSVTLIVYNVLGQKVSTIFNGRQPAGHHAITWNASEFASGIYIVHFQCQGNTQTQKMLLLR